MIFTDPPYGVDYKGQQVSSGVFVNSKRSRIENDAEDAGWLYEKSMIRAVQHTKDKAAFYIFYADGKHSIGVLQALVNAGLRIKAILIWHKINTGYGSLNQRYKQRHEPIAYCSKKDQADEWFGPTNECTVWDIERKGVDGSIHPTMKPIAVIERAIKNSTTENQIVLDLFLGSGSTLIACEQTGRICYGMEIDPRYVDVIIKRWEEFTGKKAVLEK